MNGRFIHYELDVQQENQELTFTTKCFFNDDAGFKELRLPPKIFSTSETGRGN
jgi:hypothetical protein